MPENALHNLVGTAGEYFVCAEPCRQGYLALLTPKNNPLFDIVVTNPKGTAAISIQVKTRSVNNTQGWKFGGQKNPSDSPGTAFTVLVKLHDGILPVFYVYRYCELTKRVDELFREYISKPKRNGEARKDPGFRWFDDRFFTDDDHARKNNWQPILQVLEESKKTFQ